VEATAEVDILPNLVAFANYTYTDAEDLSTGLPLPREPKHRGTVGLTWEALPRLSLWVKVFVTSQQFESKEAGYNAGYTRVDAGGVYRLIDKCGPIASLELTARLQNLLNESYAEVRGFPALGIQALVGLRANF
jgi:outer membrane receptor protein involved in Fe transport